MRGGRLVAPGFAVMLLLIGAAPAVRADEIGDAIAEAGKSYAAGDVAGARASLGEAMQLLSQRAATQLGAALPAALPGWRAEDVETSTAAAAMLGGGAQASRRYIGPGDKSVTIQVMADNPIVAQLGMIFANPAMAGAMGKLIRIGSQRAIQNTDNEIQMLVENRIIVTVSGDAPIEAKLAFARAIDLAKLGGK